MKKLALFKIRFVSCTDLEGRDLKKKKIQMSVLSRFHPSAELPTLVAHV